MISSNSVTKFAFKIFIAVTFFTFALGLVWGHIEYFIISVFLGIPFLLGVTVAAKAKSNLLLTFALMALISGWLAPLCFFWQRDKYSYSGQSAVLNFQFSAVDFIKIYIPIIIGYYLILFIPILLHARRKRLLTTHSNYTSTAESAVTTAFNPSRASPIKARLVFIATVITFAAVIAWMFTKSIGITGINPPELPFKMSGILFYTSRFVFPVILFHQLTKFRPTLLEISILMLYGCFASLASVSKAALVISFLPALIILYAQRRFYVLGFGIFIILIFYPIVGLARNYVFLIDAGTAIRNYDFSLSDVLLNSFSDLSADDLFSGFAAIVSRVGGGQDVVLASQYDNNLIAGPIVEFIRLYIFDFWDLALTAQQYMYQFKYDVVGFATGDGGFFAHMLLVGANSDAMLLFVCLYQGVILAIGNSTYMYILRCNAPPELALLYAIFFCILYFVFSIPLWLNVFIVATSLAVRTRFFKSFFHSRKSLGQRIYF